MISQELIKAIVPWMLVVLWLIQRKEARAARAGVATLYCVVLAGFSSNFTPLYRELGQAFSLALALLVLTRVFRARSIPRFVIPLLGIGFFIVLSLIGHRSALSYAAAFNFISVSLVAIIIVSSILEHPSRKMFIRLVISIGVVLGLAAIVEGVALGSRAEGTFANPNYLAFFLGVASCFALSARGNRAKWAAFLVISIGIYFTQSRAGLVFPLAALAFHVISLGLRRALLLAPILLCLVAFAMLVDLGPSGMGRDVESSDAERFTAIEAGLQMTWEHPFVGVGWGRYMEEFWGALGRSRSIFPETEFVNVSVHRDMVSHNDFVRLFAELGILGGIYFLVVVGWCIKSVANLPDSLRFTFGSAVLGTLVFSFTHNNLNSSLFWVMLLFPIAAVARENRIGSRA